jgi:ubiquinone/menaquinone biosynthesis C-methylase UbiE
MENSKLLCEVPAEIFARVRDSHGAYFESIAKTDRQTLTEDMLDPAKSLHRAKILQAFTPLEGRKLLEVGCGYGTNLIAWIRRVEVDGYGVQADSEGFESGYRISRELFALNGLDPSRVVNSPGERIPFDDDTFDIVYSGNVLEHTQEPERVLDECIRVLKPGGVMHAEVPNHLSYFEGHYLVLQPPIIWKPLLPLWVKWIFRRDPSFARTLRTEINPLWCRRVLRRIGRRRPLKLLSLGEEIFREKIAHSQISTPQVRQRIGGLVALASWLNRGGLLAGLLVRLQAHFPIYITVRKEAPTERVNESETDSIRI